VRESLIKNWKTTAAGLLTIGAVLAPIWAPPGIAEKIHNTVLAIAATGLLAAHDPK
jgi:hypothetical protein